MSDDAADKTMSAADFFIYTTKKWSFFMYKKRFLTLLAVMISGLLMFGCASYNEDQGQYSGYLEDYSQMEKTKDTMGEEVLRFVSPQLNKQNYQKVLIEPVQYFPEPNPTDNVSAQTLNEIKNYIDQEFKKKVNEKVPVVEQPGPGVVRMRVGLTAVEAEKENLKSYQFIPVALVVTAGHTVVQGRPEKAVLYLEAEMSDSVSGKRLAVAVRSGTGEWLNKAKQSGRTVTLDAVKPLLDLWAKAYADFVFNNFGAK